MARSQLNIPIKSNSTHNHQKKTQVAQRKKHFLFQSLTQEAKGGHSA